MHVPQPARVTQEVAGQGNIFTGAGDIHVTSPASPSELAEERVVAALLEKVWDFWIEGVLERSVHHATLIALGKTAEPESVEQPWERLLELAPDSIQDVLGDASIGEIFADAHGMLVILGEPGSGKTTTLLELARECARMARADRHSPVPVVLTLSTWSPRYGSFREWLLEELNARYRVGKRMGRRLLEHDRLILLLDGLDEIQPALRDGFVAALHRHLAEHPPAGIAISCRTREYRELERRLKFNAALRLEPLSGGQVEAYVASAGGRLDVLGEELRRDDELRSLARSPLMLSILALTYLDGEPAAPGGEAGTASVEARRDRIFSAYVSRMVARRGGSHSEEEIRARLAVIARKMAQTRQTVFAVELVQPNLLAPRARFLYAVLTRMGVGVLLGLVAALFGTLAHDKLPEFQFLLAAFAANLWLLLWGAAAGAVAGLIQGWSMASVEGRTSFLSEYVFPSIVFFIVGLSAFLLFLPASDFLVFKIFDGILLGCGFALTILVSGGNGRADFDISLQAPLAWSWKAAGVRGCVGAGLAVVLNFLTGLLIQVLYPSILISSSSSNPMALVGFVMGAVFGGLRRADIQVDQAVSFTRVFARNFRLAGGWLVGGLAGLMALSLLWGPDERSISVGERLAQRLVALLQVIPPTLLLAGLWYGGADLLRHKILLLMLRTRRILPSDPRRLLDDCVNLILMQKVGLGYMFIHRLLLEHFAGYHQDLPTPRPSAV